MIRTITHKKVARKSSCDLKITRAGSIGIGWAFTIIWNLEQGRECRIGGWSVRGKCCFLTCWAVPNNWTHSFSLKMSSLPHVCSCNADDLQSMVGKHAKKFWCTLAMYWVMLLYKSLMKRQCWCYMVIFLWESPRCMTSIFYDLQLQWEWPILSSFYIFK